MIHKVSNFGPSNHNLAILGIKMVQKWDFLKNQANPHNPKTPKPHETNYSKWNKILLII